MKIINLTPDYLEECVALFLAGFQRQAAGSPALDTRRADAEVLTAMLEKVVDRHGGIAVTDNARLVGYMAGILMDDLSGSPKRVYCPEWAHAAQPDNAFDTYRTLYQAIGQRWADAGCTTHTINLLHVDTAVRESMCWSGFGYLCIDAVRLVELVGVVVPSGLHVIPVESSDVAEWLPMLQGLNSHLAASPVFKPDTHAETAEELAAWLAAPDNHAWMALMGTRPVGFMKCAPREEGAAWLVDSDQSFAVNGAFVNPAERAGGVARTLLSTIMSWAQETGRPRCSVNFEATNPEACRFWLRHFQPVCVSMVRRLDGRVIKA